MFARFQHPDGAFEAHHATDRFWETRRGGRGARRDQEPRRRQGGERAGAPSASRPAPFNTTAFTTEASSRLGITPKRAMQLAEDLYMDGFISYPRTDNTVYPRSLPTRELVASLVRIPEFEAGAFPARRAT